MAVTSTAVFVFLLLSFSTSVTQPPPPPSLRCTDQLVLFSPCLPYVSAPPNNLTATATPQCCSVFSISIDSSDGTCFCYLLRQPMILGFPLDRSRVLSLSQICNEGSSDESLESLCSPSELPVLPPLQSIQFTTPSISGAPTPASPSVGLPEESAAAPPTLRSQPPPTPRSMSQGFSISSRATETSKILDFINFWFLVTMAVSYSAM